MCCCLWEYCYHLQNADETTTPLELGTADEMSGRCRPADIREQRNIKHLWTPSDDRLRIEISGESLQLFYRHSASSLRKHLRNRKAKAVPTASSLDGDPKGTMHTFGTLIHFAQKVRGSEKWLEFPEIHSSTLHEAVRATRIAERIPGCLLWYIFRQCGVNNASTIGPRYFLCVCTVYSEIV